MTERYLLLCDTPAAISTPPQQQLCAHLATLQRTELPVLSALSTAFGQLASSFSEQLFSSEPDKPGPFITHASSVRQHLSKLISVRALLLSHSIRLLDYEIDQILSLEEEKDVCRKLQVSLRQLMLSFMRLAGHVELLLTSGHNRMASIGKIQESLLLVQQTLATVCGQMSEQLRNEQRQPFALTPLRTLHDKLQQSLSLMSTLFGKFTSATADVVSLLQTTTLISSFTLCPSHLSRARRLFRSVAERPPLPSIPHKTAITLQQSLQTAERRIQEITVERDQLLEELKAVRAETTAEARETAPAAAGVATGTKTVTTTDLIDLDDFASAPSLAPPSQEKNERLFAQASIIPSFALEFGPASGVSVPPLAPAAPLLVSGSQAENQAHPPPPVAVPAATAANIGTTAQVSSAQAPPKSDLEQWKFFQLTKSHDFPHPVGDAGAGGSSMVVLHSTGEVSYHLPFSAETEEREKELHKYYQAKIDQLTAQVAVCDAKALEIFTEYMALAEELRRVSEHSAR
eukprot:TRINITY_DN4943_c0_g1_i6.p1 TRINITY_DN4943_c0_g1~~TRINITY_DN4943_c0_g1_i6.p1  ORF type:complete len:517 (-),score=90.49 TRINITY_DN4943_c0_g1_i6:7-1557(-)